MASGWQWDDTLFSGTAAYYRRGRLPYAPGLADALTEALGLDGRGRLLDVGCGPGTIALRLAHAFAEIVGLDPDGGMIAEARRGAAEQGVAEKAVWVQARAEDLPAGLGTFTVVAFAQSFHWMDRDLVAWAARGMLRPGGALAHLSDLKTEDRSVAGLPHPPVPYAAMDELVRRYLGPVRRAGRGVLPQGTPGGEAAVFARAGLLGPERLVVPGGQALERTDDDVVAGVFSMSFSAPHLFGPRRRAFESDLRDLLRATSPSGRFAERAPSTEVFLWRAEPTGR
ncbi:class I SAM-dependent methyltransferase [Streptomyces spectabilis]|uniref:SAM-dependent methyltransferase n=1 Tax=Streptomyces spectabilis TaxID=68270 RepID=A0A5P2X647_STRST|nr:class I SAM-dependent methyltransferase [Streptomyces spectabilis]MBB5101089.1 SAM-dependent methyltransferase [Streptomyces spectabilis]MCI3900298.1 class I SAM-dependent methyltransferase [Streptomyces spectabilis]QEV57892.1 class I SAM-dependent methyltransferase [Streptomyces spectabilis]GGV09299.1 methyltransferase [Streptomyces spectabilis]